MKLNLKKTKLMLFNKSKKFDFVPDLKINDTELHTVDEMTLLGVVLSSDMSWTSNTNSITSIGYKRLWMLNRLKTFGALDSELIDVYVKQVRPVLE